MCFLLLVAVQAIQTKKIEVYYIKINYKEAVLIHVYVYQASIMTASDTKRSVFFWYERVKYAYKKWALRLLVKQRPKDKETKNIAVGLVVNWIGSRIDYNKDRFHNK
uniref:Uncharacterized protein n=1 Tax=Glossina pallidipes TaxID=7398 RepID=A0A1A9ZAW1_GLOPL